MYVSTILWYTYSLFIGMNARAVFEITKLVHLKNSVVFEPIPPTQLSTHRNGRKYELGSKSNG